jgi:6-phosphofructokinase
MKRIAVFTSGGDAPGMNACIRGLNFERATLLISGLLLALYQ